MRIFQCVHAIMWINELSLKCGLFFFVIPPWQSMGGNGHLAALPSCKLSFHWPRVDLDQLLCVRIMDDPHCNWSGGFRIDNLNSFHINMRTNNNHCRFLRVDTVLQGATFFVVFTDADSMPPPYRIDNYAEVSPIIWCWFLLMIFWILLMVF